MFRCQCTRFILIVSCRDSGGGSISKNELGELLETLGVKASPEELDAMLREVDTDGSGEIDFEEFVEVMSRRVNVPYTADHVKHSFQVRGQPLY